MAEAAGGLTAPGPVPAAEPGSGHLHRVLGLAFGVAVTIGGMVGSGLFRVPGLIFGQVPSLWGVLALFAACAVHSLLSANLWGEITTAVGLSGGTTVVVQRAMGNRAATVAGWLDTMQGAASIAQLAVGGAAFAVVLAPALAGHVGAVAVVLTVAFGLVNWRGVVMGEIAQIVATLVKAALIVGLIVLLFRLPAAAAAPAAGPASGGGAWAVLLAYMFVFGTYAGWTTPGYFTEETADPGRNIPRSLALGILGSFALFAAMILALAHALPMRLLAGADFPAALALGDRAGGGTILTFVAMVTALGCLNANIMPVTRGVMAMGRARFAPHVLARVNRGGTPDLALLVTVIMGGLLAATGRYETIFLVMGTQMMALLLISDLAFFALRRREPELARPFRAWGGWALPVLALLLDAGALAGAIATDLESAALSAASLAVLVAGALLWERWQRRVANAVPAGGCPAG